MTAGVEGLPTDARDRLAAEMKAHVTVFTPVERGSDDFQVSCKCGWVGMTFSGMWDQLPREQWRDHRIDAIAELTGKLCGEARVDELRAAAAALHVQRFNADEEPDSRWPPGHRREVPSFYAGIVRARTELRTRAHALTGPQPAEAAP